MDKVVRSARTLRVGAATGYAILQGSLFALSFAWNDAVSSAVGELFTDRSSTLAKLVHAFVLTLVVSTGIFVSNYFCMRDREVDEEARVTPSKPKEAPTRRNGRW